MHPNKTTWKFFLLCLINLFLAAPIQSFFGFAGLVATELLFFLLLGLFWARKHGGFALLRIREVPLSSYFWAIVLSLLAIPTASLLNSFVVVAARELGLHYYVSIDPAEIAYSPAVMLFVLAVVPGLCEEVMFRGFFQGAYEKHLSAGASILLSAFLFGLIHFNIYNFLSPMYLGILFGLLVQIYGSLIPAVIGHTFFNAFIYYVQLSVEVPESAAELIDLSAILSVLPLSAASLFASALILRRLRRKQQSGEEMTEQSEDAGLETIPPQEAPGRFSAGAWIPLLLSVLLFAAMTLFMEWAMRGYRLV